MSATMRNITFSKLKYLNLMFNRSHKTWKKKKQRYKNNIYPTSGENLQATRLPDEVKMQGSFMEYREMISDCKATADRSLLLQLNEQDNLCEVISRVQKKYGNIEKGFCFSNNDRKKLVLVEFSNNENLGRLAESRVEDASQLDKDIKHNIDKSVKDKILLYQPKNFKLDSLINCNSISDQIMHLYKERQMSEAMVRVHFFIGMLVLRKIRHIKELRDAEIMFHGSASCGLALEGSSDLDMVILKSNVSKEKGALQTIYQELKQSKQLFGDVIHLPHAKVPIVKFEQIHTKMSCDICFNTLSGVYMAEVLYWVNKYEPMFYPLVVAVKMWGKEHNMIFSGGGHHFSNFMMTMLMLAYLQQIGLLPALKTLYTVREEGAQSQKGGAQSQKEGAQSPDQYSNDISVWQNTILKKPKTNMGKLCLDVDIGEVLMGFFQFYSKFSFAENIIDVHLGKIVKYRHKYQICVVNPNEIQHNICKNVREIQVDKFQMVCRNSAKILELCQAKSADSVPWGLASILSKKEFVNSKKGILFDLDIDLGKDEGFKKGKKRKKRKLFDLNIIYGNDDGEVEKVEMEVGGESELDKDDYHIDKCTLNDHGNNDGGQEVKKVEMKVGGESELDKDDSHIDKCTPDNHNKSMCKDLNIQVIDDLKSAGNVAVHATKESKQKKKIVPKLENIAE